jgi:DNA-binding NarL/FixJ family response regulator
LLIKLKVQDFLGDYPHLKKETEELVSVAMLACVEAINRVKDGSMQDHDNITGYIRVAIWRFLGEWVNEYLMNCTRTKPLPNTMDIFESRTSWIFEQENTANGMGESCLAVSDDSACFEIRDVLESLGLVENEWYVIERRLVGDTNAEIADALDVTEFTIRFILSDIYRRFTEKYEV